MAAGVKEKELIRSEIIKPAEAEPAMICALENFMKETHTINKRKVYFFIVMRAFVLLKTQTKEVTLHHKNS